MKDDNKKRYPFNGTFELTARCNLQCKMCLIRIDDKRMKELGGRERTASEWISMAKEVRDAGTMALLITGGEPMLRPDFAEIYEEIAQMGFMLTLYTNATLVSDKIYQVLEKYPPHQLGITVYGASPETYERVSNNAGGYNRMLQGVDLLRRLPSMLSIRTTIIKDNLQDLESITKWALELGEDVNFNVSRIVTKPVRGGIADVEACRLSPEQNISMLKNRAYEYLINPFGELVQEGGVTVPADNNRNAAEKKVESTYDEQKELYGCKAGMRDYTITWDGKLIGCQLLGDSWTYPFITGFQAAWEDFPNHVKLPPVPEECRACPITCSACPATRLAETGTLDGIPKYLCTESRLAEELKDHIISQLQKIVWKKGMEINESI